MTDDWETLAGNENMLILAACPGDECVGCGGLIAQSCRRGRPPFVLVLTDGCESGPDDGLAMLLEQRTRAAAKCLGLPSGRLLMAGLRSGAVPAQGRDFESVVHGVTMIMWARDCNIICAPLAAGASADRIAASVIAATVARRSGVGLLNYQPAASGHHAVAGKDLNITWDLPAKRAALNAHHMSAADLAGREVFVPDSTT